MKFLYSAHLLHLHTQSAPQPANLVKSIQLTSSAADDKNTMWCKHCQQDVPGLASPDAGKLVCMRCGMALGIDESGGTAVSAVPPQKRGQDARGTRQIRFDEPPSVEPLAEVLPYDGWELDEQLRHIGRVLDGEPHGRPARNREIARLDPPHGVFSSRHLPPAGRSSGNRQSESDVSALSALGWVALLLGTTAFFCGGILLGWSMFTGREDLWTVGLPITLGGQIALLLGLVMQLDRIFRDNHDTSAKLDDVDGQLRRLKIFMNDEV